MRLLSAALITMILLACCAHRDPSRVQIANHLIISFLINYASAQVVQYHQTGHYHDEWAPDAISKLDPNLAALYAEVRQLHYLCSGSISKYSFSAACFPDSDSGLTLSFFIDQTLTLRMSGEGAANSESPVVRLTDQERALLRRGT